MNGEGSPHVSLRRMLGIVAVVLVGSVLIAGVIVGVQGVDMAPAAPKEPPRQFGGNRSMNTDAFALVGGEYAVEWAVRRNIGSDMCFHALDLEPADANGDRRTLVIVDVNGAPQSGVTLLHRVAAGRYVVRANSGCVWAVTIRPT